MRKLGELKRFLQSKAAKMSAVACVAMSALSLGAFADDPTTTSSAVDTASAIQTSLSGIQGTILVVLASAAGLGIVIFGFFLAWHYGKRIFKTVAK